MQNEITELAAALQRTLISKNTLTVNEFKKYHSLYKASTDKTTDAYKALCSEFADRISIYDPLTVVDPATKTPVIVLPSIFTRVDTITLTPNPIGVINKFDHSTQANNPLRTDNEESLDLFKQTIRFAQDPERIKKSVAQFEELSRAAGFDPIGEVEEARKEVLDKLEWS